MMTTNKDFCESIFTSSGKDQELLSILLGKVFMRRKGREITGVNKTTALSGSYFFFFEERLTSAAKRVEPKSKLKNAGLSM